MTNRVLLNDLFILAEKVRQNKEILGVHYAPHWESLFKDCSSEKEQLQAIKTEINSLLTFCGSGFISYLKSRFDEKALQDELIWINPKDQEMEFFPKGRPLILLNEPGPSLSISCTTNSYPVFIYGTENREVFLTDAYAIVGGRVHATAAENTVVRALGFAEIIGDDNSDVTLLDYCHGKAKGKCVMKAEGYSVADQCSPDALVIADGGTVITHFLGMDMSDSMRGVIIDRSKESPEYYVVHRDEFDNPFLKPAERVAATTEAERRILERYLEIKPTDLFLEQHYPLQSKASLDELRNGFVELLWQTGSQSESERDFLRSVVELANTKEELIDVIDENICLFEFFDNPKSFDFLRTHYSERELSARNIHLFDMGVDIDSVIGDNYIAAHNTGNQRGGLEAFYYEHSLALANYGEVHLEGNAVGLVRHTVVWAKNTSRAIARHCEVNVSETSVAYVYGESAVHAYNQGAVFVHDTTKVFQEEQAITVLYDDALVSSTGGTVIGDPRKVVNSSVTHVIDNPEIVDRVQKSGDATLIA